MTQEQEIEIEERILRRIPLEIAGLSAVLSVPAVFLFDLTTAILFLAGGVFGAVTFTWLKQTVYHVLSRERKKALTTAILMYSVRLILIIGIFFIIIFFFSEKILSFSAGFSTLLIVFFAEAVGAFLNFKQWKH